MSIPYIIEKGILWLCLVVSLGVAVYIIVLIIKTTMGRSHNRSYGNEKSSVNTTAFYFYVLESLYNLNEVSNENEKKIDELIKMNAEMNERIIKANSILEILSKKEIKMLKIKD